MANPQLEDGYTPIANDIVEALMKVNLSSYESRILWFLFRKTYGWGKKTDWLALSQFSKDIGIDRRLVHRAIKGLSSKKMIVIERDDNGKIRYGLQKDFDKWELSSKKMTVIKRDDRVSSKEMTRVSSNQIPTKETITKENIQKKPPIVPQPDFVRKETWDAYVDHRKKIKKPLTDQAAKLIIKILDEFRMSGQDPGKILEQSIVNGWTGIFELKSGGANGNGTGRRFDPKDKNWHDREVDEAAARANAIYYGKT